LEKSSSAIDEVDLLASRNTALMWVVKRGNGSQAISLLDKGVNPNIYNPKQRSPLSQDSQEKRKIVWQKL
jgi:ankyrin repeat protein